MYAIRPGELHKNLTEIGHERNLDGQKDLTKRARKALDERNLERLKELDEASSHGISTLLGLSDVRDVLSPSYGTDSASDLPLMEWLLEKVGYEEDCCNRAFGKAAEFGPEGLPTMQLLLEKGKVSSHVVGEVLLKAVADRNHGEQMIRWLLHNAEHKLSKENYESALRFAARFRDLSHIELIWKNMPSLDRSLYHKDFMDAILENGLGNSNPVEILEWLADRALLVHGTVLHIASCKSRRLEPEIAAVVEKHLNAMGIEKTKKQVGSNVSFEETKVNFRTLFEKMKPSGLPFFASAYRRLYSQLDTYALKWIFVKAAAHGPAGQDLMQSMFENSLTHLLTYHTLLRASQIAEKYGHTSTAAWIVEQQKLHFSKEDPTDLDPRDVKLLLACSQNPSGYRPLGDAPERYGWVSLRQKEDLDWIIAIQDLEMTEVEGKLAEVEDPFKGSDVTVIDDDRVEPPTLTEIRKCEAERFRQLYALIKLGYAPFEIKGSDEFQGKILDIIRKLLSRPSGRWALLFAWRLPFVLSIKEGEKCEFVSIEKSIFMNCCSHGNMHFTRTLEGKTTTYEPQIDSSFFHEMLHAIHEMHYPGLFKAELDMMKPSDRNYDDLEEQLIIAGVDEECDMYEAFALSENVYNFERGYPKRYGHHGH